MTNEGISTEVPVLERVPQIEPLTKMDGEKAATFEWADKTYRMRVTQQNRGVGAPEVIFGIWQVTNGNGDQNEVPVGWADFEINGDKALAKWRQFDHMYPPRYLPQKFRGLVLPQQEENLSAFFVSENSRLDQVVFAIAQATLESTGIETIVAENEESLATCAPEASRTSRIDQVSEGGTRRTDYISTRLSEDQTKLLEKAFSTKP